MLLLLIDQLLNYFIISLCTGNLVNIKQTTELEQYHLDPSFTLWDTNTIRCFNDIADDDVNYIKRAIAYSFNIKTNWINALGYLILESLGR